MTRYICFIIFMLAAATAINAQNLNGNGDNIVGKYEATLNKDSFKVNITKNADGSYRGQLFWVKDAFDKDGKKLCDENNPDKSLRNVPCDQIVIFDGLKYNAAKQRWDSTKIYEPRRGIKANLVCRFEADGRLKVKGSLGPIGESHLWTRLK